MMDIGLCLFGDHGWVVDHLSVKSLISLEGLFEIIYQFLNECVLGREIIRVFFMDT